MPVIASNYSCLVCGHQLSGQEIAAAHFIKQCPACRKALEVNAPGALTRSPGATVAGLLGMVLGLGACVVTLTLFDIDETTLNGWPPSWQAGLAIAVVSAGILLAYLFQRLQVNSVLAAMGARLRRDGRL